MYIFLLNCEFCGRRGGLMVSALVPGSSGPGSSPGQGTLCCVGNLTNCGGVTCDGLASHPGE